MICKTCGTQNPDTGKFCVKCGTPLAQQPVQQPVWQEQQPVPDYVPPVYGGAPAKKTGNHSKKLLIIGGAILLVIAIALVCVWLVGDDRGGDTYEEAIGKMIDGMYQGDLDKFLGAMPEEMEEILIREVGSHEYMEHALAEEMEDWDDDYGRGWTYSYEIEDVETYDAYDLEDLQSYLQYIGIPSVEAAKEVEVEVYIFDRSGALVDEAYQECLAIQIDGRWYIIPE